MKMKLIALTLENFKCHERLEIRFDGRNASIYGQNAVGKSSVYDGLTWLLFGKDSRGKKDFDIKPLAPDGNVKDHGAITSVEAVLSVDGAERTLKRTYYEVWSTRRGNAEAAFDGHSSDYFVDGVPCKKTEFARRVGEIIDENAFRLLTSITYFAAELPWQERRAALFDVAAVAGDKEILASDVRFKPLTEVMKGLSLDDFRRKLTVRRKELNRISNDTPARLDECAKTVTDLCGIDFDALEHQKRQVQARRTAVQRELDQVEQDGGQMELQNQLSGVRNELGRLENENEAYRLRQQAGSGQEEAAQIRQSINALHAQENRCRKDLEYLRGRQKQLEDEVADFRAKWTAINKEQFLGGVCPTCGQNLPEDKLEASKAAFEQDKSDRKAKVVADANRAKAVLKGIQEDAARLEQELAEGLKQAEELNSRLHQLEEAPETEITDMEDYAVRKAELEAETAELQKKLNTLDEQSAAQRKKLRDTLAGLDKELDRISGELAKKTALDYAKGRMEELRKGANAAANELNQVDGLLFLCEEFLRYKARFIEESINRRFSLVRFRLFREQINGGLEDCCDVTVNGIPYATGLNSGARVNAGIDIINTLSRHYDAQVPLFVDNAEGVTRLEQADTQVIRLVVSEADKELRCELTDGGLH